MGKAECEFVKCWETLVTMKYGPIPADLGEKIIGFQPKLARAIFKLEEFYRTLRTAEREAVRRKSVTSDFASQMRELATHRERIKTALKLGRALGDAFAWFFYRKAQHRLDEHLSRPAIPHLPSGVGGR